MSVEGDVTQQDANLPESSAPESSSPEIQSQEPAQAQPEQTTQAPERFDQHPRFRELIESNRQYKEQLSAYEQRLQEMQAQYEQRFQSLQPKPEKQVNEFVAKLREINPSYAEYIEGLESKAAKVEELMQKFSSFEQQTTLQKYETTLNSLHEQHKAPSEWQGLIKDQIDLMAMKNPKLGLKDLPTMYKEVHGRIAQFMEGVKRQERATYVQDKSKDAAAPVSQPKGKIPGRNDKGQFVAKDRETLLSEIAKSAVLKTRAESEI